MKRHLHGVFFLVDMAVTALRNDTSCVSLCDCFAFFCKNFDYMHFRLPLISETVIATASRTETLSCPLASDFNAFNIYFIDLI